MADAAPTLVPGALAGKVALVTGSAIGLGAAIARRLASLGARLVVTGYPIEPGEALARGLPHGAVFMPADLTDAGETRMLAGRTLEICGGLDILVNNAADSERATLAEITPELFDRQFHLIVRAPLLLAQAALASLTAASMRASAGPTWSSTPPRRRRSSPRRKTWPTPSSTRACACTA
jgi:NAD(P)-dependent dehydrogenase (short-subunit alcohol dehydrogenase family)